MANDRKVLEDELLKIRKADIHDLNFLFSLENNSSLWYVSDTYSPFSKLDIRQHLESSVYDIYTTKQLRLIIENKAINDYCGIVDLFEFSPLHLRAGIGIVICEKYRDMKIATNALQCVIDYCVNVLMLKQLWCYIDENNINSIKLFKKLNFEQSGFLKAWKKTPNGFMNVYVYQLIF
ncbi:MAG: GNAT family N-acetyltransferase [Bacteroidales bacterium]|jgi:diamine N-acetyltransferase|nr:GNAT family N-acetyltransferase [Bacteroidales bacterium]